MIDVLLGLKELVCATVVQVRPCYILSFHIDDDTLVDFPVVINDASLFIVLWLDHLWSPRGMWCLSTCGDRSDERGTSFRVVLEAESKVGAVLNTFQPLNRHEIWLLTQSGIASLLSLQQHDKCCFRMVTANDKSRFCDAIAFWHEKETGKYAHGRSYPL